MNLGIQDAVALADALTAVLGGGPDSLLDDYSATRRPIARQVVELTDRLTRLATLPRPLRPVRNVFLGIAVAYPWRGVRWRPGCPDWSTADAFGLSGSSGTMTP